MRGLGWFIRQPTALTDVRPKRAVVVQPCDALGNGPVWGVMRFLPVVVSSVHLTRVGPSTGSRQAVIVPDGCVDLLWTPGFEPWVAGPDTRPAPVTLPVETELVRVQLRTGWAGAALGVPIDQLIDQRVSLWECWRSDRTARDLRSQLDHESNPSAGATAIVQALAGRDMAGVRPAAAAVIDALGVGIRTAHLDEELRTRTVRRSFIAAVGYPPKTYELIQRFQRFMRHRDSCVPLAQLAVALGYSDQKHFSRDVRRFSGRTPAALLNEFSAVSVSFNTLVASWTRPTS